MSKIFTNVKGQEGSVSILSAHLSSGQLSHAYLFLGPDGVGKDFLASEFARYILCPNHKDDACDSCRRFVLGSHPDYIHIDGKEGIKIEEVRQVIERVNLSPNLSKKKVVLFSGAENIGNEAANALLKTLEEPPTDTVILMTAISEKSLPITIVSRTQKIKLKRLSEAQIKAILGKEYSSEDIETAMLLAGVNLELTKKVLADPEYKKSRQALKKDVADFVAEKSLTRQFLMLEKYEKSKELRLFFDGLAEDILKRLAADNLGSEDVGKYRKFALKILKIYSNLNYNVNLRASLEELIIESHLNE